MLDDGAGESIDAVSALSRHRGARPSSVSRVRRVVTRRSVVRRASRTEPWRREERVSARDTGVSSAASTVPDRVAVDALEVLCVVEPASSEPLASAKATHGVERTAAPMPSATASAPARPTHAEPRGPAGRAAPVAAYANSAPAFSKSVRPRGARCVVFEKSCCRAIFKITPDQLKHLGADPPCCPAIDGSVTVRRDETTRNCCDRGGCRWPDPSARRFGRAMSADLRSNPESHGRPQTTLFDCVIVQPDM